MSEWDDYGSSPNRGARHGRYLAEEIATLKQIAVLHLGTATRVVDIGCGRGQYVALFTYCIGVDKNKSQLAAATSVAQGKLVCADARYPPFQDESFDGLLSLGLIEHFADHRRVLSRWLRLVRPNGRVVLSVPNGARRDYLLADWVAWLLKKRRLVRIKRSDHGFVTTFWGHEERWTADYLARLCKDAGLVDVEIRSIVHFPAWLLPIRNILPDKYYASLHSSTKRGFVLVATGSKRS